MFVSDSYSEKGNKGQCEAKSLEANDDSTLVYNQESRCFKGTVNKKLGSPSQAVDFHYVALSLENTLLKDDKLIHTPSQKDFIDAATEIQLRISG
ncbi:hypothetical protein Zmor_012090 [Zophobas morio]|jgi:hypothetical protein|uniref:Uncharacterized protein n=1 Tax=Zophobas morio TaxID=2755281 RepID=A0AA38HGH8_9CUCU|nr:hypothetical protein Zmor_012090 [Zophobas morio]